MCTYNYKIITQNAFFSFWVQRTLLITSLPFLLLLAYDITHIKCYKSSSRVFFSAVECLSSHRGVVITFVIKKKKKEQINSEL